MVNLGLDYDVTKNSEIALWVFNAFDEVYAVGGTPPSGSWRHRARLSSATASSTEMNDLTHAQSFTAPKVRRAGMARRAVKTGKRLLFYIHRWLGVTTCLLSVMWFLSGLVMLYVPFPAWSDEQRIEALPPITGDAVKVLPDEALARSGLTALPTVFRLEMGAAGPVYRIVAGTQNVSVSAVTGAPIGNVSEADARAMVAMTTLAARSSGSKRSTTTNGR